MIRAHVVDAAALAARSPAELSMYLRAHGWSLISQQGSAARWTLPANGDEFEVIQPLDPDVRDYASRVRDVVSVLGVAEARSELDILRRITNASMDVHLVRLFPTDQPPGMIGLEDGVQAVDSLRSLISAAAYTVFASRPRMVQPARKPQELTNFLRNVHIGPGGEGSYVLSVHTPVPPRLSHDQPSLLDALGEHVIEPEAPERQVSLRVIDAAHAAQRAAEAVLMPGAGIEEFTAASARGVSANLCEALVGLAGVGRHAFELSLELAPARPAESGPTPVRFRPDHVSVLAAAAADLRALTPEEDVAVVGDVIRLHREAEPNGEITIVGRVDEQEPLRRIWLDLTGDDYQVATRAHQDERLVSVRGSLLRRGNRLVLTQPTGFRILGREDNE
jgi:hypothetical protein